MEQLKVSLVHWAQVLVSVLKPNGILHTRTSHIAILESDAVRKSGGLNTGPDSVKLTYAEFGKSWEDPHKVTFAPPVYRAFWNKHLTVQDVSRENLVAQLTLLGNELQPKSTKPCTPRVAMLADAMLTISCVEYANIRGWESTLDEAEYARLVSTELRASFRRSPQDEGREWLTTALTSLEEDNGVFDDLDGSTSWTDLWRMVNSCAHFDEDCAVRAVLSAEVIKSDEWLSPDDIRAIAAGSAASDVMTTALSTALLRAPVLSFVRGDSSVTYKYTMRFESTRLKINKLGKKIHVTVAFGTESLQSMETPCFFADLSSVQESLECELRRIEDDNGLEDESVGALQTVDFGELRATVGDSIRWLSDADNLRDVIAATLYADALVVHEDGLLITTAEFLPPASLLASTEVTRAHRRVINYDGGLMKDVRLELLFLMVVWLLVTAGVAFLEVKFSSKEVVDASISATSFTLIFLSVCLKALGLKTEVLGEVVKWGAITIRSIDDMKFLRPNYARLWLLCDSQSSSKVSGKMACWAKPDGRGDIIDDFGFSMTGPGSRCVGVVAPGLVYGFGRLVRTSTSRRELDLTSGKTAEDLRISVPYLDVSAERHSRVGGESVHIIGDDVV